MARGEKGKWVVFFLVGVLMGFAFGSQAYSWTAPKIEKPAKFADYPKRPIEFICGWGVGGGADLMARKVGELTEKFYGIKMIVNNMPGAGGAKALDYSMRQPADGYTIFFSAWDSYMNYILRKTEFGPPHLDVLLVAQYVPGAYWVLKDSEFKSWKEVIEYSKKNPYKLLLADVGKGGLGDLTLSLWEKCTGLKITYVPYDKPARRYSAFAGKHADILYEQPGDIKPLIDQGARALVFMSESRFPGFLDTPTAKELGCDITIALWRGVGINNKATKEIKDYLTKVLCAVTESPEYKKFLEQTAADPKSVLCGADAHKFFVAEYEQVKALQKK
ncbi:MAG: tripartite tricarboxylate transporter substrate binding protein [Proteobacteria bacterium]|nr:tripartite tricarboxylate transporter substrate binding protein [Pseudomonadota bacterium]